MASRTGETTRLVLVRHGEIEANRTRIWHGSTDSPLTERGARQAERAAEFLCTRHGDAVALYCSPLRRSRDTAAAISRALGLPARIEPDMSEYSIGELEGRSYAELALPDGLFERIRADPGFAPPRGESPRAVAERVLRVFRSLAAAHAGARVIVVGHGASLALGLSALLDGEPGTWFRYHQSNCGVSELALGDAPALLAFDQTDHLSDL